MAAAHDRGVQTDHVHVITEAQPLLQQSRRDVQLGPLQLRIEKQRNEFLALSKNEKYRASIKKFFDLTQPHPLDAPWVFTGSGFYVDETTGKKSYLAEGGDLICVANFPSALIDLAAKSSAEGEANLLWETWTERIPPVGTEVLLELVPDLDEKKPPPAKK